MRAWTRAGPGVGRVLVSRGLGSLVAGATTALGSRSLGTAEPRPRLVAEVGCLLMGLRASQEIPVGVGHRMGAALEVARAGAAEAAGRREADPRTGQAGPAGAAGEADLLRQTSSRSCT